MNKRWRQVLIAGCGRSGTTMMGSILGSAPGCLATPESQFLVPLLRELRRNPKIDGHDIKGLLSQRGDYRDWGLTSLRAEAIDALGDPLLFEQLAFLFVDRYAESTKRQEWNIWVDHTPDHIRFAASLLEELRDAKLVHMIRDGRAMTASVLPRDWGPNFPSEAAYWWIHQVAFGLAAEMRFPGRVIRCRYEDLVTNPEREVRRLCDFLGLDYRPEMVQGKGFRPTKFTAGHSKLVGKLPDASRIDGWRRSLTRPQIEEFEYEAGEFLKLLGYEPAVGIASVRPGYFRRAVQKIGGIAKMHVINRLRVWRRRNLSKD
jgi:hypothetical protein